MDPDPMWEWLSAVDARVAKLEAQTLALESQRCQDVERADLMESRTADVYKSAIGYQNAKLNQMMQQVQQIQQGSHIHLQQIHMMQVQQMQNKIDMTSFKNLLDSLAMEFHKSRLAEAAAASMNAAAPAAAGVKNQLYDDDGWIPPTPRSRLTEKKTYEQQPNPHPQAASLRVPDVTDQLRNPCIAKERTALFDDLYPDASASASK